MLFNSYDFWVFFGVVYLCYLLLPRMRLQNLLLLAASYYFYAAWDWRFLSLIFISTATDYLCGLGIHRARAPGRRKLLLTLSIAVNLGLLGFFKYFGFFVESLDVLLDGLGLPTCQLRLGIVLPVGISFYTFQTMSYTIDIYRRQMAPTRDFFNFALFVAFFPQLVAGPIERARNLLPQFERPRTVTREALDTGAWLIFWGLFKKIVIADNLAAIADPVFNGSAGATSLMVYLGTFAFAFQIYCDFSGYSDIARGLARVLGFELMLNFNLPYFARNPRDFWRRWHISLSTWLRDYLYIPLGGSRGGHWATNRNLLATMILGGLWHGASWNFLWWGAFHGLILVAHREIVQRLPARRVAPAAWRLFASRVVTFHLVLFGWLLFRSTRRVEGLGISGDDSFRQITELLGAQANGFGLDAASLATAGRILLYVLPLLVMQWWQNRSDDHCVLLKQPWILRSSVYAAMAVFWLLGARQESNAFIYFQF